jgi:YVTN family beta-propeller protein
VASLGAAPLTSGTRIGIDYGPVPTANWNNITSNNAGVAAGSVVGLSGTVIDGVSIATTNAMFTNNDGSDNWNGLASKGGAAPAEFVDSVTTDISGNYGTTQPYTTTLGGLNPALRYEVFVVCTAGIATTRIDTCTLVGDATYGPSAILRANAHNNGLFHTFSDVGANASGTLVIRVADTSGGNNPIVNGILIVAKGPQPPLVTSAPATEVRATSATLHGELVTQGTEPPTVWACWGDKDAGETLAAWDHKANLGTPAAGSLSHAVTGLITGTIYHFRFHATSPAGDSWSEARSFTPTLPQIVVAAGQAVEGASGLTEVTFLVTLSYPAESDVTIDYTTLHLTTDDADFTPGSGHVTIPAGETSAVITVWVNGDGDEETDEQFILRIDGAAGLSVTAAAIQGMILSDDGNHLSPVAVAADTADGLVYVALHTARRIAVVDAASEQFLRSIALPGPPSGLCLDASGSRLYVAAGGVEGKIYVIDTATGALLAAWPAGHTPISPLLAPDGATLYVCNRFNDDVSCIAVATGETVARVAVEREPHAAAISADGTRLFVANLLPTGPATSANIAAHVTVINTTTRAVAGTIPLPTGSHSLRGMCMAPGGGALYVSHILSRYYAPTTQVTRGWMNTNALTVINPATAARVNTILLDDLNQGAPNPWGVACSPDGAWLCVAHAGNHEISAINRSAFEAKLAATPGDASTDLTWLAGLRTRIPLGGNGPRGLAVAAGKLFAAQYFSDSLGIADLPGTGSPAGRDLTVGWRKPPDAVRLGEMYYNDATLCLQQWQSCASCHPDARADGLNWDLLNDGFGNPKNTKSHLASIATPPAMATGIRANAQVAVRAGLRYIQFVNRDESFAVAIDAYLTALEPVPSPYLVNGRLSPAAANGQAHFQTAKCATCHSGPAFTDLKQYNMGTGIGREAGWAFDTPTLLENWRSAPFMHDGRAATLRDVIVTERHGDATGLAPAEIDELILYLQSL